MSKFEDAVEWVVAQAKDRIVDHAIDVPELGFAEVMLSVRLPVEFVEGGTVGKAGYVITDFSEVELVRLAETIPGAYDFAVKITATNILCEANLGPALRAFAFEVLSGKRKRPNPNPRSKRHKTWWRNSLIYGLAKNAAKHFDLPLTRNDSSPPESACDAVEQGLGKLGHHTSFKAIKDICVHKSSQQMRLEYELWEAAISRSFLVSLVCPVEDDIL